MTVLQALKISVGYPLDENFLTRIMVDRQLDPQEEYAGSDEAFLLARADVYMGLAVSPDVMMDGFTLSVADRNLLVSLAEGIYRRYEPDSLYLSASRNTVQDRSEMW